MTLRTPKVYCYFADTRACTICSKAGEVVVAVQPSRTSISFTKTSGGMPHTVAATSTGASTVLGIWLVSACMFCAILLETSSIFTLIVPGCCAKAVVNAVVPATAAAQITAKSVLLGAILVFRGQFKRIIPPYRCSWARTFCRAPGCGITRALSGMLSPVSFGNRRAAWRSAGC